MKHFFLILAIMISVELIWDSAARADPPFIVRLHDGSSDGTAPAADLTFSELQVVSERPVAQVCFAFNLRLDRAPDVAMENYVQVDPPVQLAATVRDRTLCLEGFAHGQEYKVTLLAGLPAVGGRLANAEEHTVAIGDMRPSLTFASTGSVLPRLGNEGLPIRTVNLDKVHVQIARIHDRNLIAQLRNGRLGGYWAAPGVAADPGEWAWEGDLLIDGEPNKPQVTALPIADTIGVLRPGVYVATATAAAAGQLRDDEDNPIAPASQWFVVSDLGLSSFLGENGLVVQVRSLQTAQPLAGIELALLSRNNKDLARSKSDAEGIVRFDAGLVRGRGGNAAAAVFAYGAEGEFSVLGLEGAALDLSDRGVDGRTVPGPLDAFVYAERGIYRPGETARVTLLLRDDHARPVEKLPLTVKLVRPDGVEADAQVLSDQGGGSYLLTVALPMTARTGEWTATAFADPKGASVGGTSFQVADFVPPRIEFDLSSPTPRVERNVPATVDVAARYLYGAPAADLNGELAVVIRPSATPYPDHAGYCFGLVQDADTGPIQLDPQQFKTDAAGHGSMNFTLAALPDTTLPLEVAVHVSLFDISGRPVQRALTLPVVSRPLAIGVKPRFDGDSVAEDARVGFDVIALGPDGKPVERRALAWELVKVYQEWAYFTDINGRANWQRIERDSPRIAGGSIDVTAAGPVSIEQQVGWGHYRLELFDLETGAATSTDFYAAWWGRSGPQASAPDRVAVTPDRASYNPGETARVFVQPPFDADVLIAVSDRGTRQLLQQHIGKEGATVELPLPADATAGAYLLATAFAAPVVGRSELPQRAIGAAWLAVDRAPHRLDVTIDLPDKVEPAQTLTVPVAVAGAEAGQDIFLTLAAVDDGVLQLTGYRSPAPLDYYLGKRRLGVDIRDLYGDLIDPAGAVRGQVRTGGDMAASERQLANTPKHNTEVVSLFSGIVKAGPDGKAQVPLALPDFNGRLRLMAVAWSGGKLGSAEQMLVVRALLIAELSLPLYLAPEDRADLALQLRNLDAPEGDYSVTLKTTGPIAFEGLPPDGAVGSFHLARDADNRSALRLHATGPGEGDLHLTVSGPAGFTLARDWHLSVRPENPLETHRLFAVLDPGRELKLDWNVAAGLYRQTAILNLTVTGTPDFDVPGLVGTLARDPYYWTDSVASRGVPFLYFGDVARSLDLGDADRRRARVESTIAGLLNMQVARGTFAPAWLYYDDREEEWLTAYVLDFLTRAREQGFRVPELPYQRGVRWLSRFVAQDLSNGHDLAVQAYAYYVLARSRNMDAGRLRRFFAARGDMLPTAVARAQVAAALAIVGDRDGAAVAFNSLEPGADGVLQLAGGNRDGSPYDYRSPLRDRAAVLALMAESRVVDWTKVTTLAAALARDVGNTNFLSSQEMAWLLYLAHDLGERAEPIALNVDGQALARADAAKPYYGRFTGDRSTAEPLTTIRNDGTRPIYAAVSATGNPLGLQPALENGFTVSRSIVDRFGHPVDLQAIGQNDLLVVIIEGRRQNEAGGQTTIADMLPAGLEIQNVRLTGGQERVGDLDWLGALSEVQRAEYREDRFVAMADISRYYWTYQGQFRMAYLVRAVMPGDYVLPGAYVEDMFRPGIHARSAATRIKIVAK